MRLRPTITVHSEALTDFSRVSDTELAAIESTLLRIFFDLATSPRSSRHGTSSVGRWLIDFELNREASSVLLLACTPLA